MADEAPTARRGRPAATPKTEKPALTDKALREGLEQLYGSSAMILLPLGYANTAAAVAENVDPCVDAWMTLAAGNKTIRKTLERMVSGSTFGVILAAHWPIVRTAIGEYQAKHVVDTVIEEVPDNVSPFPTYPSGII